MAGDRQRWNELGRQMVENFPRGMLNEVEKERLQAIIRELLEILPRMK